MRFPVLAISLAISLFLGGGCRLGFDVPAADEDALPANNLDEDTLDALPDISAVGPCPVDKPGTVALYTFDDDVGEVISDRASQNPGDVVNGTAADYIAGPGGCGRAISFDAASQIYGQIPNSDAWELTEGSIDLWVWPVDDGVLPIMAGIVSRDATGVTEGGHFTIYQWHHTDPDSIVVRIQSEGFNLGYTMCSTEPLQFGRWNHVGVNFGPPRAELWINGVYTEDPVQILDYDGVTPIDCNVVATQGIDGNSNPWTLGVSQGQSADSVSGGYFRPLAGGALDHLRISDTRRDFAAMNTAARD